MAFEKEIAFLSRKLLNIKVTWKALPAVSQIISDAISNEKAKEIYSQLKNSIGKKAVLDFPKFIRIETSKSTGITRIVVMVHLLREYFASEIDGGGGGGGRGYNPLSTRPSPKGAGV